MSKITSFCRRLSVIFATSLLLSMLTATAKAETIPASVDQILARFNGANIGVEIQSMKTGQILYQRNAGHHFTPASTLKIFTAAAALSYLGPSYTFKTQLLATTSTVNQGILNGDVYLKFDGDPTLTRNDLAQLLDTLAKAGVRTIHGNLYLDDTLFDQVGYGPGWMWDERDFCYSAPMNAIILNKNCFTFSLVPGRPGERAVIKNSVFNQFANFNNSVHTIPRKGKSCPLSLRATDDNTYDLSGCVRPANHPLGFAVSVKNVRLYAKSITQSLLQQEQINLTGKIEFKKAAPELIVLAEHDSASLAVLVRQMLKKSDNVIANALYKKLGAALYGVGTWKTGSLAIAQILGRNAHIDFKKIRIVDGAGLSRYNLVTPAQAAQLLYFAYHDNNIRQSFLAALPISGIDGTLRYRMGTKDMIRRVSAKTGTMESVSGLAGYVETDRHQVLSFVIIVNSFIGPLSFYRTVEDKICTYLAHRA